MTVQRKFREIEYCGKIARKSLPIGHSAIGENFHHLRQAFVEPALVNPKFGVTNRRYLLVVVGLG